MDNGSGSNTFAAAIDAIVWDKDVTVMEAVLMYAEDVGIEPETVGDMVKRDPVMRSKIEAEAADLCMLKGGRPPQLHL